jgi:hypothetical protein
MYVVSAAAGLLLAYVLGARLLWIPIVGFLLSLVFDALLAYTCKYFIPPRLEKSNSKPGGSLGLSGL